MERLLKWEKIKTNWNMKLDSVESGFESPKILFVFRSLEFFAIFIFFNFDLIFHFFLIYKNSN